MGIEREVARGMGDLAENDGTISVMNGSSEAILSKKRKIAIGSPESLLNSSSTEIEIRNSDGKLKHKSVSPASSVSSGGQNLVSGGLIICSGRNFPVSCCSSNYERNEVVEDSWTLPDLEAKGLETQDSKHRNTKLSREKYYSELSDEMETTVKLTAAVSPPQKIVTANMPPKEEIEDFFSKAEKYEQKRFAEKFNYDIVKDSPLEGRYQWIRLN